MKQERARFVEYEAFEPRVPGLEEKTQSNPGLDLRFLITQLSGSSSLAGGIEGYIDRLCGRGIDLRQTGLPHGHVRGQGTGGIPHDPMMS